MTTSYRIKRPESTPNGYKDLYFTANKESHQRKHAIPGLIPTECQNCLIKETIKIFL
jgi:hypothetical protein